MAFVFPLALGHGAPWPQPSGRFDVSVNGSRVAGFPIVADSQRWSGAGCELLLWVRGVRAAEPGTTLQLDEVVRDESLFVDALAFLRVPARLLTPARRPGLTLLPVNRQESTHWARVGAALDTATPPETA